jgi:hypothetical protein
MTAFEAETKGISASVFDQIIGAARCLRGAYSLLHFSDLRFIIYYNIIY